MRPAPSDGYELARAAVARHARMRLARRIGLGLSVVAVLVSLVCGYFARKAYALGSHFVEPEHLIGPVVTFLVLLLVALLLRMGAAVCELLWLERTWSNVPEPLRNVGPLKKVDSLLLIGVSFVPGIAWIWKLGLIVAVCDGFEAIRKQRPFAAPIPRGLGKAAVIVGWVPGLNVYFAPFLWELFAVRVEKILVELDPNAAR